MEDRLSREVSVPRRVRVGVNSPDTHLKPHAVFHAEKETAPAADFVSLPAVSDPRGSGSVEDFAQIGPRTQLPVFDDMARGVFHDEPCRLILHE